MKSGFASGTMSYISI